MSLRLASVFVCNVCGEKGYVEAPTDISLIGLVYAPKDWGFAHLCPAHADEFDSGTLKINFEFVN